MQFAYCNSSLCKSIKQSKSQYLEKAIGLLLRLQYPEMAQKQLASLS